MSWTRWSRRFAPKTEEAELKPLKFVDFVNAVRPGFVWDRHTLLIANVLQKLCDRNLYHPHTGKLLTRLMIFMPPRHGKSELVSRLFTAYHVYRYQRRHVMLASYGERLARSLSRASRGFFAAIGGVLDRGARAAKNWMTPSGGGMWADSIHGALTGLGSNCGVLDDPVKNAIEATSDAKHDSMVDNYRSAFLTRLEVDVAETASLIDELERQKYSPIEIMVLTRWPRDLAGVVLEEEQAICDEEGVDKADGWYIIDLPAICEEPNLRPKYPSSCYVHPDWREPGEALWPARMSVEKLARIRRRIGEYFWSALFQQRPDILDGDMFNMQKLQWIAAEKVPFGLPKIRWWDRAATKGKGKNKRSHTAGVRLEGPDRHGNWYVTDVVVGQWDIAERDKRIRSTAEDDGLTVQVVGAQDPGQAGKAEAAAFIQNLAGFPVSAEIESGSKETRAVPFASQFNAGKVFIVQSKSGINNAWHKHVADALRGFPDGGIIDIIDAAANAFNKRCGSPRGGVEVGGESRGIKQ